jgi:hypothetical protein
VTPSPSDARNPVVARGRRRVGLIAVFGLVFSILAGLTVVQYSVSSRLRRAVAAADQSDPGWRVADLERKRFVPKAAENPALLVLSLIGTPSASSKSSADGSAAVPPIDIATTRQFETRMSELQPPARLPADMAAWLRTQVDDDSEAIQLGRKLADMGEGRFDVNYAPIVITTVLPQFQGARGVALRLHKDAYHRAEVGDIDGAVDSSRAVLGVGRSIGDEVFYITQLIRVALEGMTLKSFERALSQGEASDAALRRIQSDFSREEKQPLLLYALRGERAHMFEMLDRVSTGEIRPGPFSGVLGGGAAMSVPLQIGAFGRHNQGVLLETMNQAVEIAKRPLPEQAPLWARWSVERRPKGTISRILNSVAHEVQPFGESVAAAFQRSRAILRAGVVMAACERYRLAHKRWPERLDQLVPQFLDSVPQDPYGGKPLRMARTQDGLVVYAVGADLKDDGGKFDPKGQVLPGFDVGFRLWDVDRRHQPLDGEKADKDDARKSGDKAGPG